MNPLKIGDNVPALNTKFRKNGEWHDLNHDDIFTNKRVVIFSLPGAFTPTCSSSHVPRFEQLFESFQKEGIDAIYCISVNDAFVMDAWAQDQHVKNIQFIPDGNGTFTEAMGLLVDKSGIGFGKRSWRYAMVVNNGVIEHLFIEPEKEGDPFEVSDADSVLKALNANAQKPHDWVIFTRPGCPFCLAAKQLLHSKGINYDEVLIGVEGRGVQTIRALTGKTSVPQIYKDGEYIGGSEELIQYFA